MLNPDLDLDTLAAAFRNKPRLVIPNILVPEAAEILHRSMGGIPWDLTFIEGGPRRFTQAQMAAMPEPDRRRMMQALLGEARDRFQFLYNSFPMISAYREGRAPDHPLHAMVEVINGPLMELVKRITGDDRAVRADAQATLYAPGHFLTRHTDAEDSARLYAYVMGFTKAWRAEWGAQLQFLDRNGGVEESFVPTFNTLTLFRVPQLHHVSHVPIFAPVGRYTITGWFYDRP